MSLETNLGRALLHNHTTYSDGLTTIEEFFRSCQTLSIDVASIWEHDNVHSFEEAQKFARTHGIIKPELVPGIEVTYGFEPLSHIGFMFPPKTPVVSIPMFMGFEKTVEFVITRNPEAVPVLCHPILNRAFLDNPKRFFPKIKAIEANCKKNSQKAEKATRDWVRRGNVLSEISGADTHFPYPYDPSWNYITLFPGNTADDLIMSIANGTTIASKDNNKLYFPTLPMMARQSKVALFDRSIPVTLEAIRSFRR